MTAVSPPALSVVVPTWNGRELLAQFLPGMVAEAERWSKAQGKTCEIVVSDDGSRDGTEAWLAQALPQVHRVRSELNRGFAPAANAGVLAAAAPLVVLLNNDLSLAPGCLDVVSARFADPELFGLTFQAWELPGGEFATGGKLGRWRRGFWETWRNFEQAGETFLMVGGFCAFRREPFLQLGGFDPIFAPYY
ncbi:MAG: glycosyltransferase family 2 protein, partial [Terriglobales bacterium]